MNNERSIDSSVSDAWPRIIRVDLPEEGSIDHDPTVDKELNFAPFLNVEGLPAAMTMMTTDQGNELSAAFDKVNPDMSFICMVLEGKYFKGVDTLRPAELWNLKLDRDFAKRLAIKTIVTALHIAVLQS